MSDMMTQEEGMNMSNEQAVQILIPMRNMMCDRNGCPISDAVFALDKAIEALSADRPQGEWLIEKTLYDNYNYRCSYCDWYECHAYPDVEPYNYCPNCGARMLAKDTNVPNKKGADDEAD